MKKKFDIRKTFETFLREPLSILTEGLFQIVNIQANNEKMANLFQTVLYKSKVKEVKEKVTTK